MNSIISPGVSAELVTSISQAGYARIWVMPDWMEEFREFLQNAIAIKSDPIEQLANFWTQEESGKFLTANYARGLIGILEHLYNNGKLRMICPAYQLAVRKVMDDHDGSEIPEDDVIETAKEFLVNPEILKTELLIGGAVDGWLCDEYFT